MIYIIIPALLIVIGIFVYKESSGYRTSEYVLHTDKEIPGTVRFVMLSDLHDTDVTHDKNAKLFESVAAAEPDFVILSGDMVTSYTEKKVRDSAAFDLMSKLSGRYKVYYGLGNHEQRIREDERRFPGKYSEYESFVKGLGIEILSDTYTDIADKNIRIYGYDIPMEFYKRGVRKRIPEGLIEQTLGAVDERKYNILLAHTPDHFEEYSEYAPDLVLSGHLHGGIIGFPGIGGLISPQLSLFPEHAAGHFHKGKTDLVVSRGIGWHSIPIRIFNKAEIVVITITQESRGNTDGNQC
ncbi:MAG: metallophosphoesterase [Lachnospiraceae bacterium]|nr:metallophosphoesterase [Lachnospiraceae bacterium]